MDPHAADIVRTLPDPRTRAPDERWPELREFNEALRARAPRAWATPLLVVANVLAFLACLVAGGDSWALDPQALTRWGSNAGLLVMSGEWYRLFTAMFLHGDLVHLGLNLWALWGLGRLVERLYGTPSYLLIYVVSGVFGGLASVAWNPYQNSVGASGAIFALLGALVVFLARGSTRVPKKIVLSHGLSALVFILYSTAVGMLSDKIDNAAHMGGMICGGLLGWLLARPFDTARLSLRKVSSAAITALLLLSLGVAQVHALRSSRSAVQRYWSSHQWLLAGQKDALRIADDVQARAGTIGETEFLRIMEQKLLPFWKDAEARLVAEGAVDDQEQQQFAAVVAEYVKLRHEAIRTGYEGVKHRDRKQLVESRRLAEQAEFALARVSRLEMRARAERFHSWSQAEPVRHVRYALAALRWKCSRPQRVDGPASLHPGSKDAVTDGRAPRMPGSKQVVTIGVSPGEPRSIDAATNDPAHWKPVSSGAVAAGACTAARAFETGDFASLDGMLHPALDAPASAIAEPARRHEPRGVTSQPPGEITLPGSEKSRDTFNDAQLAGFVSGLQELFEQQRSLDGALSRLAEWRRERPGSDGPDLVEAILFRTWARAEHREPTANSPEQWLLFKQRLAIAKAALQDADRGAKSSPVWHRLNLLIERDLSQSSAQIHEGAMTNHENHQNAQ